MQVGDLVKYKKSFTNNCDYMGLVLERKPLSRTKKFWLIQWIDGSKYIEDEKSLEVVKN